MRYLTSALISEGVTDDRFLPRLLGRALTELCLTEFDEGVDVADVLPLRDAGGPVGIPRVLDLVDRNPGSFLLLFFHHDQGASAERVEREWLAPLREQWGGRDERLVPIRSGPGDGGLAARRRRGASARARGPLDGFRHGAAGQGQRCRGCR